jgi:hypothetical protein
MKEYIKIATVKAKLFEKGDEDGMTIPDGFDMLDAMENHRYGIGQPEVPYISTLENQKHRGEFGKHYLCVGINGEKWLVDKGIFEKTYKLVDEWLDESPVQKDEAREAVEFAEWIVQNDYKTGALNERWFKWNGMDVYPTPYTTSELFNLFKQQKV